MGLPPLIEKALSEADRPLCIADLGCGPNGGSWWESIPKGSLIDAYDLLCDSKVRGDGIRFFRQDATKLCANPKLECAYDLVVADHVFEHVWNPADLARSAAFITKRGGRLHVGIPDASNFTDRFYRLVHRDSGGHVTQFTRESFVELVTSHGFSLVDTLPWPDDWAWFEHLFNLERYEVKYFTHDELAYIANVFRKELTPDKGYLYGWEFLFQRD